MPLHSAMSGSELHQDRYISTAVAADAGKVTTPSAIDGTGELRKLLVRELDGNCAPADTGKVYTPSGVTNDLLELRQIAASEIDNYKVAVSIDFTDIGTAATEWTVLPHAATSVGFYVVLYGAITVADETVTVKVGTATALTLVVPFTGSGAGIVTAKASTVLDVAQAAGVKIQVDTAGTSTGATRAKVVVYSES